MRNVSFILLSLLTAGCLDDGARDLDAFLADPAYQAYLDEVAADEARVPDVGQPLCSAMTNGAPWQGYFENQSMVTVSVVWVEPAPSCKEQYLAELPPGARYDFNSAEGLVWRVRVSDPEQKGAVLLEIQLEATTPPAQIITAADIP